MVTLTVPDAFRQNFIISDRQRSITRAIKMIKQRLSSKKPSNASVAVQMQFTQISLRITNAIRISWRLELNRTEDLLSSEEENDKIFNLSSRPGKIVLG